MSCRRRRRTRTATTSFADLNPGSYTITVDREGFKKTERVHTVVDVNQTNQQNISLPIGSTPRDR